MAIELKQLEDKPWYYGLGIGLALAVGLWAVANWQYPNFKEMQQRLAGLKAEYGQLQEKIERGRVAERRLPQLREEVRRIELDLNRLLEILPTKRNTEELIKKIEALTRQGDFFLKDFRPKEYVNKDFYAEWPIDVVLDGTYHNLALFFDKMARFSRIINVESLTMTGYPDARLGRTLGATFTLKTFIYLGDQASGPGAAAPPGGAAPAAPAAIPSGASREGGV
ncbi:MAG TPA: type 4a pilus biogenesis protein PilO [Thermoanaerobaculia bacterium]|nr:type 4a pilus biogenesis protein PilO [Thermoanaerobaculia bacterium]